MNTAVIRTDGHYVDPDPSMSAQPDGWSAAGSMVYMTAQGRYTIQRDLSRADAAGDFVRELRSAVGLGATATDKDGIRAMLAEQLVEALSGEQLARLAPHLEVQETDAITSALLKFGSSEKQTAFVQAAWRQAQDEGPVHASPDISTKNLRIVLRTPSATAAAQVLGGLDAQRSSDIVNHVSRALGDPDLIEIAQGAAKRFSVPNGMGGIAHGCNVEPLTRLQHASHQQVWPVAMTRRLDEAAAHTADALLEEAADAAASGAPGQAGVGALLRQCAADIQQARLAPPPAPQPNRP